MQMFFWCKVNPADLCVSCIIWNFKSPMVLDWIHTKEEELLLLSFSEFMPAALYAKWLVSGWEFKIASVLAMLKFGPELQFRTQTTKLNSSSCSTLVLVQQEASRSGSQFGGQSNL